jgi:hypothetical protein
MTATFSQNADIRNVVVVFLSPLQRMVRNGNTLDDIIFPLNLRYYLLYYGGFPKFTHRCPLFLHWHVEAVMSHSSPTFSCLGKVLICFLSLVTTFHLANYQWIKPLKWDLKPKRRKILNYIERNAENNFYEEDHQLN